MQNHNAPLMMAGMASMHGSQNTVGRQSAQYSVEVKDDEMPQIPTLSLHVAQHDIKHEREMFHKNLEIQNNTFMRLFAEQEMKKRQNQKQNYTQTPHETGSQIGDGDLSKLKRRGLLPDDIESDAEEIYVPELSRDPQQRFNNILGYQKYLNIMSQIAQNNSDEHEPIRPNYSNFMQVLEEENEEDEQQLLREQAELEAAEAAEAEAEAERLAREAEDAELALLDEDGKRKTKFNFSGMSFAEYVKSIKESLNNEMREIVN